jgi:chromosome segregation ATPase
MSTDDLAKLKQTLDELHAELERLDPADDQVRTLLSDALADIQTTLQRKESGLAEEPSQTSLPNRLTSAAREFEETHPHLAGLVGSVIDALSRMGI